MPLKPEEIQQIKETVMTDLQSLVKENPTKEDNYKLVEKIGDYISKAGTNNEDDIIKATAARDFIQSLFNTHEGSKEIPPERAKWYLDLNAAFIECLARAKIAEGEKLEAIENQVKNKEFPGTEYLLDDTIEDKELASKLARNIFITRYPEIYDKQSGLESAYYSFSNYANQKIMEGTVEQEIDGVKQIVTKKTFASVILQDKKKAIEDNLIATEYPNMSVETRKKYLGKDAKGFLFTKDIGFELNPNYGKEGEPFFTDYPEHIKTIMQTNDPAQLEDMWNKQHEIMEGAEAYEKNALKIAEKAKVQLELLDSVKNDDPETDPKEFKDLRKALVTVSEIGMIRYMDGNKDMPMQKSIYPKDVDKSLKDLWRAAKAYDTYQKNNSSMIYEDEPYEKHRAKMSKKLMNFAELSKPLADAKEYGIPDNRPTKVSRATAAKQIRRIEKGRELKGFAPFKPHVVKGNTIADKIAAAKRNGEKAKENVTLGSKKYDKAVASLDTIAEAYQRIQAAKDNKEIDINVRRGIIIKAMEDIEKSRTLMNDYMERKRKQGHLEPGGSTDIKSQKRINAVNEGLDIISSIEHEVTAIREAMYAEDIQNEEAVKQEYANADDRVDVKERTRQEIEGVKRVFTEQANTQQGYLKTSANYALHGLKNLDNFVKTAKESTLTNDMKETACLLMAAVVYHDMLRKMPQKTIEKMKNSTDMEQNDADINATLQNFATSDDFRKLISGGVDTNTLDITVDTIEEFLANPSKYGERIIENRKAVRNIKNKGSTKELPEEMLQPLPLDRAINLWK